MRAERIPKYTPLVACVVLLGLSSWAGYVLYAGFEDLVRFLIRETAYISTTFFLLAYFARPLRDTFAPDVGRRLVQVRRQLGLAAALAHTVHFGVVVALFRFTGESVDLVTLIFGGLGFVMFWLLALTSNSASVRMLGANWKRLHRFGIHYIWIIFMQTYLGDVLNQPVYWLFVALLAGGLVLRIGLSFSRRAAVAS